MLRNYTISVCIEPTGPKNKTLLEKILKKPDLKKALRQVRQDLSVAK